MFLYVFVSLTLISASLVDISNSGGLDDVADNELFDGLVLGHTTSAVGAVDVDDVSSTVLGTATISPLLGLKQNKSIRMRDR